MPSINNAGTSGAKKAAPQTREDIIKQLKQMEGAKFRRYGDWPIPDGKLTTRRG